MSEQGEVGRPGKQGAQGVQGSQGVQGIQGTQGEGHTGEPGPKGERGAAGAPWRSRNVTLSFWAIVIVAVGVTGIQGYAIDQNRDTIHRLKVAEDQQAADRAATRERFVRSDRTLCREIERLKARDRADAIESHRNLDRTLRLLNVKKTPEIVKLANDNYRRQLRQTKPRNCAGLPPPEKKK